MSNWEHKDLWKRYGKDFMVEVSRHQVGVFQEAERWSEEGPHRWCVYAYIYPKHPHFAKFSGPEMFQDAACSLPLHCGPSFLRWHYADDGKPTSVQVGCDYNHLHDSQYTRMATKEEAQAVFNDAEKLFDWLAPSKELA